MRCRSRSLQLPSTGPRSGARPPAQPLYLLPGKEDAIGEVVDQFRAEQGRRIPLRDVDAVRESADLVLPVLVTGRVGVDDSLADAAVVVDVSLAGDALGADGEG